MLASQAQYPRAVDVFNTDLAGQVQAAATEDPFGEVASTGQDWQVPELKKVLTGHTQEFAEVEPAGDTRPVGQAWQEPAFM